MFIYGIAPYMSSAPLHDEFSTHIVLQRRLTAVIPVMTIYTYVRVWSFLSDGDSLFLLIILLLIPYLYRFQIIIQEKGGNNGFLEITSHYSPDRIILIHSRFVCVTLVMRG